MADPTVTQVLTDAAALLGDVAQEQFTAAVLLPWYGFAYRELFDICQRWRLPLGQRIGYGVVPALTNTFVPEQAGIADFGQPIELDERGGLNVMTVTSVSNATPMVVTTAAPHGLTSGTEIEITGVTGPVGVNDQWFVTVLGVNTFILNGSYAGGAYVSGGTALQSSDKFTPIAPTDELPENGMPTDSLQFSVWRGNRFYFVGALQPRELMLTYTASGNAPVTGTVGFDNSRNHLAVRTASLIAGQYDMPQSAKAWAFEALGPSGTADGTGGTLRNLVGPMLLAKQLTVKRPGTFRPRRNRSTGVLW